MNPRIPGFLGHIFCADLPALVQLPDGLLQRLLLLFGQDVRQLVARLQERVQNSLIQLLEEVLQEPQRPPPVRVHAWSEEVETKLSLSFTQTGSELR